MSPVIGHLEKGQVRLSQPVVWADGQRVVVIPLPQPTAQSSVPPPVDLLDEDAEEFTRRPETLRSVNEGEL